MNRECTHQKQLEIFGFRRPLIPEDAHNLWAADPGFTALHLRYYTGSTGKRQVPAKGILTDREVKLRRRGQDFSVAAE